MRNTPFLLIINDGWGVAPVARSNAITAAKTPVFKHLLKNYWVQTLQASGDSVGLPWGEMGNSEVGHLSLGAGKIIYQELPRITRAISDVSFFNNQPFLKIFEQVKQQKGRLHVAGLVSDGGVHSHIEHLYALLEFAAAQEISDIAIHCFLDGRDVAYNSALGFIDDLEQKIHQFGITAKIATIAGRYWAMDRDNRWDRVASAYQALVYGESAQQFPSAQAAIKFYYQQQIFDEQIPPTVIIPRPLNNLDGLIFFNFRADRMRQLATSLVLPEFNKFARREYLRGLTVITMTEYDKDLPVAIAFPPEVITHPLARVLSDAHVRQLHIAETEKYAHVTFFFNGGREAAFPGETRILIPSPSAENYATVPAMSAREITNRLIREINTGQYDFIVVNFANADLVGHTGDLKATIQAVEVLDRCFKLLIEAILALSGTVIITADHGNAEVLFDGQTGEIDKEHTSNPVPCLIIGKDFFEEKTIVPSLTNYVPRGVLADVAPTILKIMGITIPIEMTGRPLV